MLEQAADMERRGDVFVLATVVWRREPSSGRLGEKALVLPEGTLHGWLGGACAEPTIVREALTALDTGEPRLLYLGLPDEEVPAGAVSVPMSCTSEGALQVYLEPVLPKPRVVVIGHTPAVETLASLTRVLGWSPTIVDDGGSSLDHTTAVPVRTTLDLESLGVGSNTAVIVATQGHYDEQALEAALATDAAYVGLVSSVKRADSVRELLRDRGVPDAALARIHAPAGLDLGSIANEEIAVAVLAELVSHRAAGLFRPQMPPPAALVHATDPVCGMAVDVASTHHVAEYQGQTYYFCAAVCQRQFEKNPTAFLG